MATSDGENGEGLGRYVVAKNLNNTTILEKYLKPKTRLARDPVFSFLHVHRKEKKTHIHKDHP